MDEELQIIRRAVSMGEPGALAKLDAVHDRLEGVRPGTIQRMYDPRTWSVSALLVDATSGPVRVTLPGDRVPGLMDWVHVKKLDSTVNPVTIHASRGTTFEHGDQVWREPIVTQYQSVGPFVLSGRGMWVIL